MEIKQMLSDSLGSIVSSLKSPAQHFTIRRNGKKMPTVTKDKTTEDGLTGIDTI